MLKDNIKNIRHLKSELLMLHEQIEDMTATLEARRRHDTVKGSSPQKPFRYHTITVHGVPVDDEGIAEVRGDLMRLHVRKRARAASLKRLIGEAEDFLDRIDDPQVRVIAKFRVLDGMSWR